MGIRALTGVGWGALARYTLIGRKHASRRGRTLRMMKIIVALLVIAAATSTPTAFACLPFGERGSTTPAPSVFGGTPSGGSLIGCTPSGRSRRLLDTSDSAEEKKKKKKKEKEEEKEKEREKEEEEAKKKEEEEKKKEEEEKKK